MPKKRLTTEDHLALLRQLRTSESAAPSPGTLESLSHILASPRLHGIVLKGIADLAHKWSARALAPALQTAALSLASDRIDDAPKRDPGCEGKQAVLQTLIEWDGGGGGDPDFFLHASHWTQFTPIFQSDPSKPSFIDTAAECRGLAAIGIARTRPVSAEASLARLLDLLTDDAPATRARTAQALSLWSGPEAAPLLRLKALLGDDQPEVLGECLASLLHLEDRGSTFQLSFVIRFLEHADPAIIEAAALALGENKGGGGGANSVLALSALTAAFDRFQKHPIHTSLLTAIALLRSEDSLARLLQTLATSKGPLAREILSALSLYRADPRVVSRIQQTASRRPDLLHEFTQTFAGPT